MWKGLDVGQWAPMQVGLRGTFSLYLAVSTKLVTSSSVMASRASYLNAFCNVPALAQERSLSYSRAVLAAVEPKSTLSAMKNVHASSSL